MLSVLLLFLLLLVAFPPASSTGSLAAFSIISAHWFFSVRLFLLLPLVFTSLVIAVRSRTSSRLAELLLYFPSYSIP